MKIPRMTVRSWMGAVAIVAIALPRPAGPLECFIRATPTCLQGTDPKITVAIFNRTDSDIYLVGSLDGSEGTRRYPHCYFEVTGPDGAPITLRGGACAYMNALREKDFMKVPPGGQFDPYQHIDEYGFFSAHMLSADAFRAAGKYRIRFVYSTRSRFIDSWRGPTDETHSEIRTLFEQVPKVEIKSNEIEITVVAPGN